MNFARVPVLADVAERAGVSLSTVSRVITGRVSVSRATKERVEAAIQELGYRPNAAAQALVSGRRSVIAVFARNTVRYGYAVTLQGIEEAARAAGFTVIIAVVESSDDDELQRAVSAALSQPLAGAIVIEFDAVGTAVLDALPATLPVVAAAGAPGTRSGRPHAHLDDAAGGRAATEYLLSLGHATVHHIAIPATRKRSGREWGWQSALRDAGATVPDIIRADYDFVSGYDAVATALDVGATALLCGNDEVAIGAGRALHERGRSIPGDVSIMGFDDQPFAAMWTPALSTVRQDFDDLGRRAFALLERWLLEGATPQNSLVSPTLVIRESTGPAPR